MTDPTEALFEGLDRRGHQALLEKVAGTVRFDLARDERTDHWFVVIQRGDVSVSREEREADCVVHAAKALFDRVAIGEENTIAALLRGEMTVDGKLLLFIRLERLLPGPPDAHDPRRITGVGRRQI